MQVDVINMSYGEYSHWSNTGRVGELMHEVINKYGVVWVASAGNNGPALCTVGTPPDIATNSVIGKILWSLIHPKLVDRCPVSPLIFILHDIRTSLIQL